MKYIDVARPPVQPIQLGWTGDSKFESFEIDISAWLKTYPDASFSLIYRRPDGYTSVVAAGVKESPIIWQPSRDDMSADGVGRLQVRLDAGEITGMSDITKFSIRESLSASADPAPERQPTWVELVITAAEDADAAADRAEAAVEHYPQIRNSELWVWNINTEQWEKLDVSGGGGSDSIVYVTEVDPLHVSMSASEILSAVENGKFPVLKIADMVLPYFSQTDDGRAAFAASASSDNSLGAITFFVDSEKKTRFSIANAPTKTSDLINDSIKEPVYLTVTTENGTTSVDKTPAEIDALSAAGYDVHLRIQIPLFGAMLDMRFAGHISQTGYAAFTTEYLGLCFAALVASDKTVEIKSNDLSERLDMVENDVDVLEAQISQIGTVFTLKGGVATVNDLPQTDNSIGDVWYVENVSAGFIWITSTAYPDGYWEELGETVDLSAYAEKTWVQNQGYQTASDVQTAIAGIQTHDPRVAMASTDTSATLNPNTLYVFPEMASLTITLAAPADNTIANEYHFIFTSGATATTLTIPATVNQPDGFSVDANMVYEVSILENNMTAMSWEVSA